MNDDNPYAAPQTESYIHPASDEPSVAGLPLASRWVRLGATILDTFIVGVPGAAAAYLLGAYDRVNWQTGEMPLNDQLVGFGVGLITLLVINGYGIWNSGQTVGKMICGIRVVDAVTGERLSGNRYFFLRILPIDLITMLPVIGGLAALIDALLIFRAGRNCLHDDISNSRVVVA